MSELISEILRMLSDPEPYFETEFDAGVWSGRSEVLEHLLKFAKEKCGADVQPA